jgi:DNA-binding response OmpR family regulator
MSPLLPFRRAVVLEDEPNLARALRIALERLGMEVEQARTLSETREVLQRGEPDLLVLDRRVPDGDGIDLCREVRANGGRCAVMVLTAAGQTEDRVEGLRAGADDYLPKPFSWEELSARLEALARRVPAQHSQGDLWEIDENLLRIRSPRGWVRLTPLEFKLATHLIRARGSIVSREELLRSVWGFTLLPKTRTVDLFVGRLRKLFEQNPEEPRHFLTIRGAGYRFQS